MGRRPDPAGTADASKHLKRVTRCNEPGCGRSFGRLDHLRRHQASHRSKTLVCPRCERLFGRDDVLARHLRRHDTSSPAFDSEKATMDELTIGGGPPANNSTAGLERHSPRQGPIPSEQLFSDVPDIIDWDELIQSLQDVHDDLLPSLDVMTDAEQENLVLDQIASSEPFELVGNVDPGIDPNTIDQETHLRLVTSFPEISDFWDQPQSSPDMLSRDLRQYWTRCHPQIPFLHRPTFDPRSISADQLAVVLALGHASLGTGPTLLRNVSTIIRSRLLSRLDPDMPLVDFQTLLLCQVHDEMVGQWSSSYAAQCFSSTIISIARRRSMMVRKAQPPTNLTWSAWTEMESVTRAAYMVMILDTQLHSFWGQMPSRRHSAFSIQVNLPAPESEWEADTEHEWLAARSRNAYLRAQTPDNLPSDDTFLPALHLSYVPQHALPGFSAILRDTLVESKTPKDSSASPWSRLILLHGINMVVFDIKMHGYVALIGNVRDSWKASIHYSMLKLDDPFFHSDASPLAVQQWKESLVLSLLAIFADPVELRVHAGVTAISGSPVSPAQRIAATAHLKRWRGSADATIAIFHAATYLRGVFSSTAASIGTQPCTWLKPWALYICVLTCWCGVEHQPQGQARAPRTTTSDHATASLRYLEGLLDTDLSDPSDPSGVCDVVIQGLVLLRGYAGLCEPAHDPTGLGAEAIVVLNNILGLMAI